MIDKELDCEEVSKEDLHKLDALKKAIKKQEAREFMPITDNPISLRDQFAKSAMQGILSNEAMIAVVIEESAAWVSREAYIMADAMLAARGK
ncbi:hypothetical protein QPK77_00165 [Providencia rettgeri]|nr:hypothetical protein [Providencia rettgeri]MDK3006399.1 hypothetical protein [Providencia rettgeri]QPE19682.1 hypothetical protein IMQ36_11115 [Providencia rettgeri]